MELTAQTSIEPIKSPVMMTLEEMKLLFPDEWVLIGDPVFDEKQVEVTAGFAWLHGKSKKEVSLIGSEVIKQQLSKFYTLVYTGDFKYPERFMTGIFNRI